MTRLLNIHQGHLLLVRVVDLGDLDSLLLRNFWFSVSSGASARHAAVHPATHTLKLALGLGIRIRVLICGHDGIKLGIDRGQDLALQLLLGLVLGALVLEVGLLQGLFVLDLVFLGFCLEKVLALLEHDLERGGVFLFGFCRSRVGTEVAEDERHGLMG